MIPEKSLINYLTETKRNNKIDLNYIQRQFSYKASQRGFPLSIKKDKIKCRRLVNVCYIDCLILFGTKRYKGSNKFIITVSHNQSSITISVKLFKKNKTINLPFGFDRQTNMQINYFESAEEEKYLDFIEDVIEDLS